MYNIQQQVYSSLKIKSFSSFHILDVDHNTQPVECMFLQEKIKLAMQLYHFADRLKYNVEKTGVSKINAL